jgi:hypothetical protein
LVNVSKNVLDDLESQGFLKDGVELSLKISYIPWLI